MCVVVLRRGKLPGDAGRSLEIAGREHDVWKWCGLHEAAALLKYLQNVEAKAVPFISVSEVRPLGHDECP